MKKIPGFLLISWILILYTRSVSAQEGAVFRTRQDYYTTERSGEVMFRFPTELRGQKVKLILGLDSRTVVKLDTMAPADLFRIPLSISGLTPGHHELVAWVEKGQGSIELRTPLKILPPQANAVKIDRYTGSLIVNDLPWFPFGFYCYSPVQPTLAEEEVVRGFNLMSPYQRINPGTVKEREAYMDRCAALGMKVHYQLISIAGRGGIGSTHISGLSPKDRWDLLHYEVEHFKNHPALLAWYISDEPTGHGASPDTLKKIYEKIKSWDPYHPVTIVFMAPRQARRYAGAMDIVMADPYPIPRGSVIEVGSVTENLHREFRYEKPVWIVPQAFGGSEWWSREPDPGELRAMTYLALVRGATGIQYFVRKAPNGFPKSLVTWSECGKMALEVAEMTPYLLRGEPVPELQSESQGLWINGWELNGNVMVVVVNTRNQPRECRITFPKRCQAVNVEEPFEHRALTVQNDTLTDWIGPLGTQVYRVSSILPAAGDENLLEDPGFEDTHSYGVPARCYILTGNDRGATAFLDTRLAVEGNHSLRVTTPTADEGLGFSFFPVSLNSGQSYRFTIYARPDTMSWLPVKKTFWQRLFHINKDTPRNFSIRLGDYANYHFTLKPGWHEYTFYLTIPEGGGGQVKINPQLKLLGQGTAWFDAMSLVEDPVIGYRIDEARKRFTIELATSSEGVQLRYNIDNRLPVSSDPLYFNPFPVDHTAVISTGIFLGDSLLTYTQKSFSVHLAMGREPQYEHPYVARYSAGGRMGLTDGVSGSLNYLDGRWQGFNGQDMAVIIDLDTLTPVHRVTLGSLQVTASWIFAPLSVRVEGSADGTNYRLLGEVSSKTDEHTSGPVREDFKVELKGKPVRFLKIRAVNRKICPDWHRGHGKPAFISVDELTVE